MTDQSHILCAEQPLPQVASEADVPEWIHLVPSGEIRTIDGRGPYRIIDPQAVIENSFAARGDLEIDVNHASFNAAPKGGDAPARGWITEMQSREDGIWGRVEWTEEGRRLVASRAYRRISPVFGQTHKGSKIVTSILNASLVNRQNLRGLAALNQENSPMPFQETLAKQLGLEADASEGDIQSAITTLQGDEASAALQSEISDIGAALGLPEGSDSAAVLNAAQAAGAGDGQSVIAMQAAMGEMQTANAELQATVEALTSDRARERAESFVDGEIRNNRAGVKPLRDHYISMHMADPARVEKEIGAMPILGPSGTSVLPPEPQEREMSLNAEQTNIAGLLGISPEDYAKTLETERNKRGAI